MSRRPACGHVCAYPVQPTLWLVGEAELEEWADSNVGIPLEAYLDILIMQRFIFQLKERWLDKCTTRVTVIMWHTGTVDLFSSMCCCFNFVWFFHIIHHWMFCFWDQTFKAVFFNVDVAVERCGLNCCEANHMSSSQWRSADPCFALGCWALLNCCWIVYEACRVGAGTAYGAADLYWFFFYREIKHVHF